jgi:iron(III) transport system ATP-binding protein
VVVAVRPENIALTETPATGGLSGTIAGMFYLGDINDCRVDINGTTIRVIAESSSFDALREGQPVHLALQELTVYEDQGDTDATRIVT